LLEGADRGVKLPLQQQRAAFQVQQVIARPVRLGKRLFDDGVRRRVVPVLQQLSDIVRNGRRIGRDGFRSTNCDR